jgi:hypothetical protein
MVQYRVVLKLGKLTSQISVLVLDDMSNQTLDKRHENAMKEGQGPMYKIQNSTWYSMADKR